MVSGILSGIQEQPLSAVLVGEPTPRRRSLACKIQGPSKRFGRATQIPPTLATRKASLDFDYFVARASDARLRKRFVPDLRAIAKANHLTGFRRNYGLDPNFETG